MPISFRIFHSFIVIHKVEGFGIVNKAEVDFFFFWNSIAFSIIQQILRILSIIILACEVSAIMQYFEHSLGLPF